MKQTAAQARLQQEKTKSAIARIRRNCQGCEQPFGPGQEIISSLRQGGADGWERRDLCAACHARAEEGAIATWRRVVPEKKAKGLVLSEDAIWDILRRAGTDAELRGKPFTYVLCLLLARKRKILLVKNRRAQGREYVTYRNMSRGFELEVAVPRLSAHIMNRLQRDLGDFLGQEEA